MQSKDDLTDLRFAAAIAQTGSLSGAARRLGVSHATAFRRIEAFEARLGVKLFERRAGRYVPTVAGEELARTGVQIELEATESLRKVAGRDLRPTGHVRVTTTDSLANGLIAPMAQACREMNPGILLQVIASNEIYSLTKRDADIAIRPTRTPPGYLIGKKAAIVAMAVYGEKNYLRRRARKNLEEHDWIAADDSLGNNASLGVGQACAAGCGLAVLPCFIGDQQPGLKRVSPLIEECTIDLWILTHPDLRNTVRVKTMFQGLYEELRRAAPLLAGRQPQAGKR
jgi:molybdate transport repressor ModE-like protein